MREAKRGLRHRRQADFPVKRVRLAASAWPVVLAGALCSCAQPPQQGPTDLARPIVQPAAQPDATGDDAAAAASPQQAALATDGLTAVVPQQPPNGGGDGSVVAALPSSPSDMEGAGPVPSPRAEPPSEEGSATPPPAFLAIPLRPADEPEIDSDPSRLFGMAEEDLRRLLGVPQFVRIDGPTRLWRYRAEACLLDLFLYPDETAESPFRVFHFEARGADNGAEPAGSCLEVLLRARPRA